ncbi:hypothetical protein BD626DRAFT_534423 [Schizophyllum amplum]|uniref:Tubby C-terminal-like domain-containing protein n=1 Tax=Schizophyllum amplum TaxID=97359 RepID=A0A550CU67_9AGAR|nr:hypothetical protein BD626DRAFT_534423 [Auriculariopsis ampla]
MPTLLITAKDILNSTFAFEDGTIAFVTTTHGTFWKGRDTTSVQGQNYFAQTRAAIDWRDKYLDINGQVLPHDRIKHNNGGLLSSKRTWTWGGFIVELHYSHHEWTAQVPSGSTIGRFRSYRDHIFHSDEKASVTLDFDIASPEATFLLLAFIYSETKRIDDEQAAINAGAASGGAVAVS